MRAGLAIAIVACALSTGGCGSAGAVGTAITKGPPRRERPRLYRPTWDPCLGQPPRLALRGTCNQSLCQRRRRSAKRLAAL